MSKPTRIPPMSEAPGFVISTADQMKAAFAERKATGDYDHEKEISDLTQAMYDLCRANGMSVAASRQFVARRLL